MKNKHRKRRVALAPMVDSAIQVGNPSSQQKDPERVRNAAFHATDTISDREWRLKALHRRNVALGVFRKPYVLQYGVVAEPHLTPFACVNYLMDSLGVSRVSVAEVSRAVAKVTHYLHALSQASPGALDEGHLSQDRAQSTGQRQRRRRQLRPAGPAAADSVLSQASAAPESSSVLATLSASQVQLTQQSGSGFASDMQDALFLEVLRELCDARPLRFTRVSYRDQRRMRERLSRVDVTPGKRAIVVSDRRDPLFSIIVGVPPLNRGGCGPGNRVTTPDTDDRSAVGITYIAVAHKPVPFRRTVVRNIPKLFYKDCALAYVERLGAGDEDHQGTTQRRGRGRVGAKRRRTDTSPSPHRRQTVLLGVENDDSDDKTTPSSGASSEGLRTPKPEKVQPSLSTLQSIRPDEEVQPDTSRSLHQNAFSLSFPSSSSSSSSSATLASSRGSSRSPFDGHGADHKRPPRLQYLPRQEIPHYEQLFYSSSPYFTPEDGAAAEGQEDPFLAIPRVDLVRDRKSRRRTWVEKLLPLHGTKERENTMARLYRYSSSRGVE